MNEPMIKPGQNEKRKDAFRKVRGEPVYAADIPVRNLLFGKLVRSPHPSGRILAISTDAARQIAGVKAILTSADVPGSQLFGSLVQDQPALAVDVVRMVGDPVVLVAAESEAAALKACSLVEVTYQALEAVFDPVRALQPDSPLVHPGGNLITRYEVQGGVSEEGFAESELILEETFFTPRVAPGYMELENATAIWNEEDKSITVWVSSQHPFEDQRQIALVLGMEQEKVRVVLAAVGGAFGGREDSSIAILAALGAYCTRGSLRLVNNRSESFLAHPKRHPARIKLKVGAKKDGTLVALHGIVHMDTGAYASYGPAVGGLLTEVVPGAYRIPHVRVETNVVYTNSPFSGAMRGFGSPQAHFAIESMMDMLASRLGMDPVEIRRKNILRVGDKIFTGVQINETAQSLARCLDLAEEAVSRMRRTQPARGKVNGIGMALAAQTMGYGAKIPDDSTHRLEWLPDGKIRIYLGAPDLGQGLAMAAEQITAEALGLPVEMIEATSVDTWTHPKGGTTCASRMTYLTGNALLKASEQLKIQLIEGASQLLNIPQDQIRYNRGMIQILDGRNLPASEFVSRLAESGQRLVSEGTANFPYPPETTPQHLPPGMPHVMFCYGAQIVRVEVDVELGTVEVKDVLAIHDVGRIIHRQGVEGQIEGGVLMGIGYALYEECVRKQNGRWVDGFTEYLMPTAEDAPANLETIILEIPEASGPYGAKGIGEITLVPTAPAIANAVFDAVHKRVTRLPIKAEDLIF